MRRLLACALLAVVALTACGSPPATSKAEYDIAAEAMKAFDKGDWALAGRLLREAIATQPASLRLHYSLAVTDTHLQLQDEAIREFHWVLANHPGTPEAEAARNWLRAAGALPAGGDATASSSTDPASQAAGDRRRATGDRRQATGDRRQATGDRRSSSLGDDRGRTAFCSAHRAAPKVS